MDKLKKSIIRYFIFFAFVLSVVESNMESMFEPVIHSINNEVTGRITVFVYVFLNIAFVVIFSILFAVIVNRKIAAETNRQLSERNRLYANIVHDLKTPMTTILGFSQALKEGRVKEAEKNELLDTIYHKTKQADELLNLLFQYTKLSTNECQMHFEQVDLCRVVRDCTAQNYELFEEKQMKVDIDIPKHPILKKADPAEISRAINNVLTNAYRHNAVGSKILIRITEDNRKTRIVIADDGDVIDNEWEGRLFEPFVCSDESRNSKGGSGLGLAISRQIVEKHGGRINIDHGICGYSKGFVIEI